MTVFWSRSQEGELEVDHRGSPGFTEEQSRAVGYSSQLAPHLREGKVMRTITLGCPHHGGHVVLNPDRERGRHHCWKCNSYICDFCHAEMQKPDYVHRTFKQVADMILSGKWRMAGGSMHNPILLPVIGDNNG